MLDKCPICLEDLADNIGVAVPCGHCYHRDCFAKLKEDSEQRAEMLELALLQRCCICKKRVRKFHNIFLSFDSVDTATNMVQKSHEEQLKEKNENLEKRVNELQALSSDQSEILCRLVPRHDHLESRYSKVKEEKQSLKREMKTMEDENWDLRFVCFDAEAKLERAKAHHNSLESKLEEAVGENRDLHEIGDSLEQQLETAKTKRKSVKTKMKHLLREQHQQVDVVKQEMEKMKKEKEALRGKLDKYRLDVRMMKEGRLVHLVAKKTKRTKNSRRSKKLVNIILPG